MIVIIGDSWGVGEWSFRENGCSLSGPGIGNYLSLHNQVINLSVGNGSNTDSVDRLELLFEQFTPTPSDKFFWIVTCPSRCFKQFDNPYFTNHAEQHLYSVLDRANKIANNACIEIQLIGGVCDLNDDYVQHFECLELVVPSWGQLIDSDYPACPYTPDPGILKYFDYEPDVIDNIERKYDYWRKSKYFPDNGHPDSSCHKLLRDTIFPEWSHKY